MTKYNKILVFAVLAVAPTALSGQNINPTVEVTNAYQREIAADKPLQQMAVPDSLLRFDLDFDYSVFDTPYKGAYEFQPYQIDMRPQARPWPGRKFYLRTGAGYSLKPTLDAVWTAVDKNKFKVDVYASNRSYFGDYRNIYSAHKTTGAERWRLISENQEGVEKSPFGKTHSGYDSKTTAGVNACADLEKLGIFFNLGYSGIHSKDTVNKSGFNAVEASFGIRSNVEGESYLYYDAAVGFRHSVDGFTYDAFPYSPEPSGKSHLRGDDLMFKGTFGPVLDAKSKVLIDADLVISNYGDLFDSNAGCFSLVPKYVFYSGRWNLSLGARIATSFHSDKEFNGRGLFGTKSQTIYPDVVIDFKAIEGSMNLYFKATGGDHFNNYSYLKERGHFTNPYSGRGRSRLMDNSVERINASVGLRGNISSEFRYDVFAGVASYKSGLLDAVYLLSDVPYASVLRLAPGIAYTDYDKLFTGVNFVWDTKAFILDGNAAFTHTDIWKDRKSGFETAPFTAFLRGRYNWNNRIYVGGYLDFASRRRGVIAGAYGVDAKSVSREVEIPEFMNLGFSGEYTFSRKLSFWARIDNVLNMTVQRVPLYSENGISVTAGICLNL